MSLETEKLENEAEKYLDACQRGDNEAIRQGLDNLSTIIDDSFCDSQNSVQENNGNGSSQQQEETSK